MDLKDLRKKKVGNLYKLLNEKRKEHEQVRLEMLAGKGDLVNKKRALKKDIAQILTLISEKKVLKNEKV